MTVSVPLLICAVVVFLLLLIEQKQSPKVSLAVWIPTIWMLCIASRSVSAWFPGLGDRDEGSPLDQLFLITLLSLGILVLASRKFVWSRAIRDNPWLFVLIGYMLVSILWSDILFVSFKRWTRELIAVVMAFLILTDRDPRQAIQSVFRRVIYILIPFSLLLIKYIPEYGRMYGRWSGAETWVGVTTQKNALGRLVLLAAFFLIWALVTKYHGKIVSVSKYQTHADVSVLILTLILLSGPGGHYSATAIVSLTAGLATFVGLLWMRKRHMILGPRFFPVILMIIIGIGILQPFMGGSSVVGAASTLGRNETLTGRTEIWASLVPDVLQNPIQGVGFGSFWTRANREAHDIGEAHNGYLDVVLELGFLGVLFVVIFFLTSCRKAQRVMAFDYELGSFWICFLLMVVIHNITESTINSFTTSLTSVVLFLTICGVPAAETIREGVGSSPTARSPQHNLSPRARNNWRRVPSK